MKKPTVTILGYDVFSGKMEFFSGDFEGVVSTINPHSYVIARNDILFRQALLASDFIMPDGTGISIASRVIRNINLKKITGSDIHETILKSLDRRNGRCFYLGSSDYTLNRIKNRLDAELPSITAGFYSPPYKLQFTEDENAKMVNVINDFSPDVLFVGMTAPKQEKWVFQNRHRLSPSVICSIGAVLDFYAGTVQRPGRFWINLGLEWLPRFLREPRRLWQRNIISTPLFLWYVLREKAEQVFDFSRNK